MRAPQNLPDEQPADIHVCGEALISGYLLDCIYAGQPGAYG